VGEMRIAYKILVGEPERKRQFRGLSTNERLILRWILRKLIVRVWTEFS
jgi:hypothetical protein